MSGQQEDVASHPLVIVRRRRNTDEAHHGGVWKIAYADFMTAMMAFFLVMWLINAAMVGFFCVAPPPYDHERVR